LLRLLLGLMSRLRLRLALVVHLTYLGHNPLCHLRRRHMVALLVMRLRNHLLVSLNGLRLLLLLLLLLLLPDIGRCHELVRPRHLHPAICSISSSIVVRLPLLLPLEHVLLLLLLLLLRLLVCLLVYLLRRLLKLGVAAIVVRHLLVRIAIR
jgi:hypothetical protein